MKRKYTEKELKSLTEQQKTVAERGLEIVVKPVPGEDRPGMLDPRLAAQMAPMFSGVRGAVVKLMIKNFGKSSNPAKTAKTMRKMFDGIKSIPITRGVATKSATVHKVNCPEGAREGPLGASGVDIPVRIYTPEAPAKTPVPVFYYIHGGGFAAGSMDVVEEMCKLLVEHTGYVCVSAGYRLAPEHPYPAGLDDCYAVLLWIAENAASFGGDGAKICIAGDSAGGNLATVCAMKDRDEGKGLVKAEALLYPTVNMAGVEDEEYCFDETAYRIDESQKKLVTPMINMLKVAGGENGLVKLLGAADMRSPYVSPYLGKLAGMPPTIILYGEYDFLRVECESYARKLQKAGVDVTAVRYSGLSHGFADATGIFPQAEDCMDEIGKFMKAHLG